MTMEASNRDEKGVSKFLFENTRDENVKYTFKSHHTPYEALVIANRWPSSTMVSHAMQNKKKISYGASLEQSATVLELRFIANPAEQLRE